MIAPDLPGFGFKSVPPARQYSYSFDALAQTILAFTEASKLKKYALYVFDYGAPVGFRLALAHPERVTALVDAERQRLSGGLGRCLGSNSALLERSVFGKSRGAPRCDDP